MMSQKKKRFYLKFWEVFPWFIAGFFVLCSNLTANYIWDLTNGMKGVNLPFKISYVILFVGLVYVIYWQRNNFFKIHILHGHPEQRKHLVLFLSNLPPELEMSHGIPAWITLSNDINADILALEEHKKNNPSLRWSWEMPLRGIRHHLDPLKLETVTIVCSDKSISQAHLFINICRRYDQLKDITFYVSTKKDCHFKIDCTSSPNTLGSAQGFDFENFDELSRAMRTLLQKFKKEGYDDEDIMIDFTGGQKMTSIVAISMTVNRKINAQYVQTNYPWDVLSYNVRHTPSDTGDFGI